MGLVNKTEHRRMNDPRQYHNRLIGAIGRICSCFRTLLHWGPGDHETKSACPAAGGGVMVNEVLGGLR